MAAHGWRRLAAGFLTAIVAGCAGGGAGGAGGGAEEAQAYPSDDLSIMAPADPGGGWDSTARAMQRTLTDAGLVEHNVEVYNVGGAGGTIGLAEFVSDHAGDPHQLMVMGLVMLGAIQTNNAPVGLDMVTPIASLTTEWEGIAVAAASPYQTLEQLITDFRADPRSISWGGGSAGGTDHMLVGLIAQDVGVDPANINYVAHAGGGEALAAILSGGVTVGVSGASEFADQVEAGQMRFLAVSSEEPVEDIDAPTLIDAGVDVSLSNWRGVVAPPDIDDQQRAAIVTLMEEMAATPEWAEAVETNGWTEFLQTGDEFDAFLQEENARVEAVLADIGLTS